MEYRDYPFSFDDSDDIQFTTMPAACNSQLGRRQQGYPSAVLTPKEKAVIDAQRMQQLTITAREQTAKAATETKAELFLHITSVYAEAVSVTVDLKDGITNPEKKSLYAHFAQRMLNQLPDALMQSFAVANAEIDRVGETDLSTLVRPPEHPEQEKDIVEYVDVTFGDWWRGGKWLDRKPRDRKRR